MRWRSMRCHFASWACLSRSRSILAIRARSTSAQRARRASRRWRRRSASRCCSACLHLASCACLRLRASSRCCSICAHLATCASCFLRRASSASTRPKCSQFALKCGLLVGDALSFAALALRGGLLTLPVGCTGALAPQLTARVQLALFVLGFRANGSPRLRSSACIRCNQNTVDFGIGTA